MKTFLLLTFALTLSSCSTVSTLTEDPTITLAEFLQLKDGISIEQAEKIVGARGVEISRGKTIGIETVMIQWSNNGGLSNANAMFQNGKLISKAQAGLK